MPFFILFAQDAPPPPPPEPAAAQDTQRPGDRPDHVEEVVVTGERGTVLTQIDRRIYRVSDTPATQTMPVTELLQNIPSVSVDVTGRIRLLGQTGVTVLIDGQRPINEQAALRSLTGADIDRIEVMTNPGVQYGPASTGGVINIITRRRTRPGLSGSMTATADSIGTSQVSAAPRITWGRWTFATTLNLASIQSDDRSQVTREAVDPGASGPSISEEARFGETDQDTATGRLQIEYRPSASQRLTLGLEAFGSEQDVLQTGSISGTSRTAPIAEESATETGRLDSRSLSASYVRTGPREGEELTVTARAGTTDALSDTRFQIRPDRGSGSGSTFDALRESDTGQQSARLDYKRPLGDDRLLSLGVDWERNDQSQAYALDGRRLATDPLVQSRRLDSDRTTVGLYASFQVPTGRLTWLPGLRLEHEILDVQSNGFAARNEAMDFYPSLHLRRPLGESLKLDVSYARRIDRPDGSVLDPALTFVRPLEATRGNPDLGPQIIDSFEVRFELTRPRYALSLTLYDKERSDLWTLVRERDDDGLLVSYPINAGRGADRGLEASVRGRLGERFTYTLTTNLFASTRRVSDGPMLDDRTAFRYLGNAQVEYTAPQRGSLPGDRLQLSVNVTGPERTLQTQYDGVINANLTWTHALTPRVSTVLTVRNLFNNSGARWVTYGDAFTERFRFDNQGQQVRFGLTYRLGTLP